MSSPRNTGVSRKKNLNYLRKLIRSRRVHRKYKSPATNLDFCTCPANYAQDRVYTAEEIARVELKFVPIDERNCTGMQTTIFFREELQIQPLVTIGQQYLTREKVPGHFVLSYCRKDHILADFLHLSPDTLCWLYANTEDAAHTCSVHQIRLAHYYFNKSQIWFVN